jgi:predicted MFS family arabinose efflux permease
VTTAPAHTADWSRQLNRPASVLAVTVLGVCGSIVFLLLPMLIGAFSDELRLSPRQVGLLGSADMAGMFVAAIAATAWIRSLNWRVMAALACALLIACHFLSALLESFTPLMAVRAVAGFAGGSLMSIALTSLGDTRSPDRYFALFVAGQLTLGALGLWLLPGLLSEFALGGVFTALACLMLAAATLIPLIPEQGRPIGPAVPAESGQGLGGRGLTAGVMALMACFVFNLGIMAVWAYLERMGKSAALDPSFIGATLALSLLAALIGALLAAAVADRYGRVIPLVVTLIVQIVALLLLSGELSRNAFAAGVMLFSFAWNFPVAYQLAITVSVDASGRLVVLFLSAVKLGYAAAPAIAAQLIVWGGGFNPVLILGFSGFVVSASLFILLAGTRKQSTEP